MKHPIRRRILYVGFQALQVLAQWLPLGAARRVGRMLGTLAYGVLGAQRRLTLQHLQIGLQDTRLLAERRQIARNVFRHLGENVMEWMVLPRLSTAELQALIHAEGIEHIRQALAKGNGGIMLTAHFGNWEFMPIYVKSLGFEGGVLARRLRHPEYESFIISARGARGVPTFTRSSIRDVAKLLRANQIIGILPDQDIDSMEGIFVDFLGRPAYTPIGPAALSLLTGAPILPCFLLREGAKFRLVVEPPLRAPEGLERAQAIRLLTQAWSDVVASYIRRYPDHWVWMHRRWKTQPEAAASQQANASDSRPARVSQPALALAIAACCLSLMTAPHAYAKSRAGKKPEHQQTAQPPSVSSPALSPASMAADQQMSEFLLTGYQQNGAKKWELAGQGAHADGNLVTVEHPKAVGYDAARKAYLTARMAQVNQQDRHVRLEQDVTIHTTDGLWFTSSILHWIPDQNQMATDQPVRIETDHMLLRGRELQGLTQLKQVTIFHDIELVLNPSDHEPPSDQPRQVTITCDGPLGFDYGNSVATFEQNVHVKDPNGDLYSDKLVAYMDQQTHTIRYAEATGRVRILQNQNTATSERAVYEPAIGKITMVGKPSLLIFPSAGEKRDTQLSFGGLVPSGKASNTAHQNEEKRRP